MRVKTTHTKVYQFEELSEKAQQAAVERVAEITMDNFQPDELTDRFKEVLVEWGFPTDTVEWSLSWSQGDGVAFYGDVDVREYLKKTKQLSKYRILLGKDPCVLISRNSFGHHYSHWNTMEVEDDTYNLWDNEKALNRMADLIEDIKENVVKVSRELESLGYKTFENRTNREACIELIEINEWEFTEDGKIA